MRRNLTRILLLGTLASTFGCNDASFKAGVDKKAASTPTTPAPATVGNSDDASTAQTLKLACANGTGDAHLVADVHGAKNTSVRLQGEFCGVTAAPASGELTVLFVLDYSGSMDQNDPLTAGSCGRLKAGQAISDKLKASATSGVTINVGVLPFGDTALPGLNPVSLAQFPNSLNGTTFCSSDGGATNYEGAFAAAEKLLKGRTGQKIIYFISDGLPTLSGAGTFPDLDPKSGADLQRVYDKGTAAALSLRTNVPDLTLNAIFLGANDLDAQQNLPGFQDIDPQTYLGKVTGSADHVRVVTNANDLAAQINTFQNPGSVDLDQSSASGTLNAASFGSHAVKIAQLAKDPTRAGVWTFLTEPFQLLGQDKTTVDNTVTLTIKGGDGKTYQASAVLHFATDPL